MMRVSRMKRVAVVTVVVGLPEGGRWFESRGRLPRCDCGVFGMELLKTSFLLALLPRLEPVVQRETFYCLGVPLAGVRYQFSCGSCKQSPTITPVQPLFLI